MNDIKSKTEFLYGNLSYTLNGILFLVHNELGRFCREIQFGNLAEQKLKEKNIRYQREVSIKGTNNVIDFIIEDTVILELKAKPFLTKDDYFQVKRYLQAANLQLGILVNFRAKYLSPKRILNPNNL